MTTLLILARNNGVGPESIVPQAIIIGIFFVVFSALAPRKTTKTLMIAHIIIFSLAAILMLYEKGYGMMAILGIICGLFLSFTLRSK
jgi:hypothetical protein